MAQFGRRVTQKEVPQTNVSDLARDSIASWNNTRGVEQRADVICKGNANLTPGYAVYVDSDYSDIKGWYYIVTAEHRWDDMGYVTHLQLQDDKFRVANEFARLQANISTVLNQAPIIKNKSFTKQGANLGGCTIPNLGTSGLSTFGVGNNSRLDTEHTWIYQSMDADQLRLPFNFLPELAAITKVRVITTRLLSTEGVGSFNPPTGIGTKSDGTGDGTNLPIPGFDTATDPVTGSTNTEYEVNGNNWVAQRFAVGTTSVGTLLFDFFCRRPSPNNQPKSNLKIAVYNDINPSNVGGSPGSAQSWIPGLTNYVYDSLAQPGAGLTNQQGQWKLIPYNAIIQSGPGNVQTPAANQDHMFVELTLGKPFVPNQIFWVVMYVDGAGSLFFKRNDGVTLSNNYIATSSDAGKTWSLQSTGGATQSNLHFWWWPSLSLTSAGDTANGNGNGLTVWDTYTGSGQPAVPIVTGTGQIASSIDFPTFVIARKNSFGQVDVSFPASAGGSTNIWTGPTGSAATAGYRPYGRWDYIANVTYLE